MNGKFLKKIVITGGHLSPAIAVIKQLQSEKAWDIYFLGRKFETEGDDTPSIESKVVPELSVKFFPIMAGKLQRRFTRYTIPALLKIPFGFIQSVYLLFKIRPDVILSFGGYVSVPVVIGGWFLGIPSLTHEQTTVVGLGTRINQFFVKKIAVSWPEISWKFPVAKVVFTGNPVNRDFLKNDENIWQELKFPNKKPIIVVTGGRQGSHLINENIGQCLPQLTAKFNILHQVGSSAKTGDYDKLTNLRNSLPQKQRASYKIKKFLFGKEWGTILSNADLVVSRAGINTLTELAMLGKPCILVPLPWLHNNEQGNNANMFRKIGLGEVIKQSELSCQVLFDKIVYMFDNMEKYHKAGVRIKRLVKKNAAQRIVDEIKKIC